MRGRVINFHSERGFGFIEPEDGGNHVFFHISKILIGEDSISRGALVDFDVIEGRRGPEAVDVTLRPWPSAETVRTVFDE